ncbi:agglutinin biogenesis protein MshP [Pseudoalteromonas tunicata]|uniref:Putative Mannose-sensitive agglutinin (MSHA) biogenesis protein MshP (Pilus type IV) n=2 Tax=Pseudoalteromonas tunicata TaxID=314281 RepID=A4C7Z8_9GAMM|nr:agglutinin biogenesis protein MshP [Pseudoalteromonas tunicata]EAR28713.1 putative Mannose-sensitive agglutinin (MSHA) biogenesis protein MshP (pilus type IV) [Pseudoalteromonas tunicata D2]
MSNHMKHKAIHSLFKQQGSMLLTALFIAILMLALGLTLVKVLSGSAHNNAVEYYGARAFLAAQSGLEKGLTTLFPLNAVPANCPVLPSLVFNSGYLANCQVQVDCVKIGPLEDKSLVSKNVTVFRLSSSATCKVNDCALGEDCRKDFWQTQRTLSVEAKTLN